MGRIGRRKNRWRVASIVAIVAMASMASMAPSSFAAGGSGPDPVAGKAAFAPCASCHQVGPSAHSAFGPQLDGIVGRRAGSAAGYAYSEAMRRSGIVWSEPLLAAFIKDADRVVPGTKMRFWSVGYDDRRIADLLAYLKTFPPQK